MKDTEELELTKSSTQVVRVYNETMLQIKQNKGHKSVGTFIADAVAEYVNHSVGKGLVDRIPAIEDAIKKIELSNETALGLLVNALSKLNLMDDKGGKKK